MGIKKFLGLTPDFEAKEEIILRDFLAIERTRLANERTLLSYIRASLYLLLSGVAILQLNEFDKIRWFGYLSLAFSALLILIGTLRYVYLDKQLKNYLKKTGLQ
jgi:putative membrane protein